MPLSRTAPPPLDPSKSEVTERDRGLFEKELGSFVPTDVFDAHAHLFDLAHLGEPGPAIGFEDYRRFQSRWMGDRAPKEGLFFPFPKREVDLQAANTFLHREVSTAEGSRGLALIRPDDDPSRVETEMSERGWAGLKVYHVFAERLDTMNAECGEFLPEWAWEIAHRQGLVLMLHLVLPRALAEERNQKYIRRHCLDYPEAKLILAHAARGFCGRHTLEGIGALRGLHNVYFDTSAICEPEPLAAVLETFGPSRLLYGSDFPVSELRGRAVSVGDGFFWLFEHNAEWADWNLGSPTLVGVESLLALKQACRACRLSDSDIERIFRENAQALLGLNPQPEISKGQETYRRAKELIPGGTQLLSKRPELYAPGQWPSYYREAKGCEVVDLDGRRYLDFAGNGIGACLLGYADPDVDAAVHRRVLLGSASTLNCPEEVDLCETLIEIHPWAQNVRLARSGGEALAIAVRIARAATGRDKIAFCGYHGWTDWYLAANLESGGKLDDHLLPGLPSKGVPRALEGTALPFKYNRLEELKGILANHPNQIAAVVMEPTRSVDPEPGFLEGARQLCDDSGAVLVFDEVTTGFRFHYGGVHLKYGVDPDLAVYAKALGNGYPISAVVGREPVMSAVHQTFISSTSWTEGVGSSAALATLRKMREIDVPWRVEKIGLQFREGLRETANRLGVSITIAGHPALSTLKFDYPESDALMTLFTVRMLARGFLAAGGFYPTLAHRDNHVARFLKAVEKVFSELVEAIEKGDAAERIGGPAKQPPFARLT
jgi:glutamate-1-semialdehyde 2,1-aminomutase